MLEITIPVEQLMDKGEKNAHKLVGLVSQIVDDYSVVERSDDDRKDLIADMSLSMAIGVEIGTRRGFVMGTLATIGTIGLGLTVIKLSSME